MVPTCSRWKRELDERPLSLSMSTETNTSDSKNRFLVSTGTERTLLRWDLERAQRRLSGTDRGSHIPDSLGDRAARSWIAIGCLWMPGFTIEKTRAVLDEAHAVLREFGSLPRS